MTIKGIIEAVSINGGKNKDFTGLKIDGVWYAPNHQYKDLVKIDMLHYEAKLEVEPDNKTFTSVDLIRKVEDFIPADKIDKQNKIIKAHYENIITHFLCSKQPQQTWDNFKQELKSKTEELIKGD